ncbi:hypothetical protein [Burkholderia sp. Ac-20349]|uniref:hypothetical protein n=1 Tax=Burkholderia sp. Ac-20349 TaxID=2703893 RepID=UPI00197C012C|nr:hypothetical protein [Burkholderia sp. Ac-20349]MBN3839064.1 hypothetical protein [Burkholderia sp. Ac-20349]
MYRILIRILSIICLSLVAGKANAVFGLKLSDLSNGYSNCSWVDNKDGTSTLRMTVSYKIITGHTGNATPVSRGLLLYAYDANGTMLPPTAHAGLVASVALNGAASSNSFGGSGYVMFHGQNAPAIWRQFYPFSANYEVRINNNKVGSWPAISLRAGNYTNSDDVGEITGGAYIERGGVNGSCKVVDPEKPPPPSIAIGVSAPDWNLGELPEGDATKTFTNPTDWLCFTYSGSEVSGKLFVINASSANGIVGGRYRLRNLNDVTQYVPYNVTLDNGATIVPLPNASNKTVTFYSGASMACFTPTFSTTVSPNVKEGGYSDVLTFTVVTKS